MGRTCGEPDEIKKIPTRNILPLFFGIRYSCARREGYNKLVLAQHLDDLAESMLMSAFHNGRLRTMKAAYVLPCNMCTTASAP